MLCRLFPLFRYLGGQGPYRLLLDTGSSTLGVASTLCTSCPVSEYGALWNPSSAVNTINTNTPYHITYGNGSTYWSGSIYNTTVTIETNYGQPAHGPSVTTLIAAISSQSLFFQPNSSCPTRHVHPCRTSSKE